MKAKWNNYLDSLISREKYIKKRYKYPITDIITDQVLFVQDQKKFNREKSLISESINREWQIAIDFGCGTGANFNLFNIKKDNDQLLIGIEPDYSRATVARKTASKKLKNINSKIVCGGVEILENAPKDLSVDLITCVQVLGHVSEKLLDRIIQGFHKILVNGGKCAIAIPIIGKNFVKNHDASNWSGEDDFTHLVNMNSLPYKKGYRKQISFEIFNKIADHPIAGKLQVRSFLVQDFPDPKTIELPYITENIPQSFNRNIEEYFNVEKMIIYSIHRDTKDSNFPVGDAFIFLRKK